MRCPLLTSGTRVREQGDAPHRRQSLCLHTGTYLRALCHVQYWYHILQYPLRTCSARYNTVVVYCGTPRRAVPYTVLVSCTAVLLYVRAMPSTVLAVPYTVLVSCTAVLLYVRAMPYTVLASSTAVPPCARATQCPVLGAHFVVLPTRALYNDVRYPQSATPAYALVCGVQYCHIAFGAISLRSRYAMSGTDLAQDRGVSRWDSCGPEAGKLSPYAAGTRCPVPTERMLPQCSRRSAGF
eukprot:3379824-Rhodomonas_salina.5